MRGMLPWVCLQKISQKKTQESEASAASGRVPGSRVGRSLVTVVF